MFTKILFTVLCMLPLSVFAGGRSTIRYVALGDSYTIGAGANPGESWPALITQRLQKKGISIELTANLAQSGWTAKDLIDYQLPVFKKLQPDFVTVLIGTNDWVQGVDAHVFEERIHYIFDQLLKTIPDPKHILILTSPDFSLTPAGQNYSNGRDITAGIAEFNQIIIKEAKLLGFSVVDLFPLSQTMGKDPSFTAPDGLHPSAKGYSRWADLIEPEYQRRVN